ncbi:MAG: bifunctional diaminohydroxyphosphoribosylaminopyrimidine deaminase/5-amino-6-(5-phosphoribosylamino)uracil reductase RibD [Flammeovirgaceae bacterium]
MYSSDDVAFMQRAFELAALGTGKVSPNPMVGCVIVENGEIIGEGWHNEYGKAHAEVNAVKNVSPQNTHRLPNSTFYVTLEPCSHFGKTPPCADLLVSISPKKVIIANTDPFPLVNGKGIEKLQKANIEVITGLLAKKGEWLNRRFFTMIRKQRPYIILKWAQTINGFIARENYDSKWISDWFSRKIVHKWRGEEDAILVGTNTAQFDNPSLTTRDWLGKNPLRAFIDKHLRLPNNSNLLKVEESDNCQTICYNLLKNESYQNLHYVKIQQDNFIQSILNDLYQRKIQSIIVEGGAKLIHSFIQLDLWDEARVFVSPNTFQNGIIAPQLHNASLYSSEQLLNDQLNIFIHL